MTKAKTVTLTYDEFQTYVAEVDDTKTKISGTVKAEAVGGENSGLFWLRGKLSGDSSEKFKLIVTSDTLNDLMANNTDSIDVKIIELKDNVWLSVLISFIPYLPSPKIGCPIKAR